MLCCVLLIKLGGAAKAMLVYYNTTMAKRRHTKFCVPFTERLMGNLHRNEDLIVYTRLQTHSHRHTVFSNKLSNNIRWR